MRQTPKLYDILEEKEEEFLLKMTEEHPVYQGHFPGNPITPGVLTLQMIRECVSRHLHQELHYAAIRNCRFVALIRPGDILRLTFVSETDGENVSVKANLIGAEESNDLRLQIDAELR